MDDKDKARGGKQRARLQCVAVLECLGSLVLDTTSQARGQWHLLKICRSSCVFEGGTDSSERIAAASSPRHQLAFMEEWKRSGTVHPSLPLRRTDVIRHLEVRTQCSRSSAIERTVAGIVLEGSHCRALHSGHLYDDLCFASWLW